MNGVKKTGLPHLFDAVKWSFSGVRSTFREEAAFRQEVCLFLISLPLAFWLGRSVIEMVLMIGSLMIVLIIEFVNTAIEAAIDRMGPEQHDLSKKAKDAGSAAVMFSLINVVFVWGMILVPRMS